MYTLKVLAASSPRGAEGAGTSKEGSPAPSAPRSPTRSGHGRVATSASASASAADDPPALLHFSTGNPRVEHILGRVHLYR